MSKIYKTKRLGKEIDLDSIMSKYGETLAVGNMSVNAKGDEIGKDGRIIRRAAERAKQDYATSEKAVKNISIKQQLDKQFAEKEATEEERKRAMAEKEAKLMQSLAKKKKSAQRAAEVPQQPEGLKPTADPNVFEKVEENGDIILVNKNGLPIPTNETLNNPDGDIDE